MSEDYVRRSECAVCRERNTSERGRTADAILALRREVYILMGTTTATIIIGALNLIIQLH